MQCDERIYRYLAYVAFAEKNIETNVEIINKFFSFYKLL